MATAVSYCIPILVFAWLCSALLSRGDLTRQDFPDGFLFGTSSSSYQYEGSILRDGKGLNNWDVFTHVPGNTTDGENGDVANDHYNRYMEDIELMRSLGVDAYRLSISWSRILPRGGLGEVNPSGIKFYNKIIDELLLRGIKPIVTIYHFDFPHELEDRYGSWLHPRMQDEFLLLADACFRSFGDRVKHWITINEPNLVALLGYFSGIHPPKHNSDTEPFLAGHNMILAHTKAANLYRHCYKITIPQIPPTMVQQEQGGQVGITISAQMYQPLRQTDDDLKAVERALAFITAWCLDPLIFGHYPPEMTSILGKQMPKFSRTQTRMINNSLDFIGVNHYYTLYVKDCINSTCEDAVSSVGGFTLLTTIRDGVPIGPPTSMPNFCVVPEGMEGIVEYLKKRYNNLPMYVTENGYAGPGEVGQKDSEYLNDTQRVNYHTSYLQYLKKAIRNGADVRGYFIWSLLDNFEWTFGYTLRFGLCHVNFDTLDRIPKLSARWYREFLACKHDKSSLLIASSSPLNTESSLGNIA